VPGFFQSQRGHHCQDSIIFDNKYLHC
jgi:hypothetical protein